MRTIFDHARATAHGVIMKTTSEYRAHARDCRALAAQMESPAQRDQMLAMAAHWDQLALDRAEFIRRRPDLAIEGEPAEASGPTAAGLSASPT